MDTGLLPGIGHNQEPLDALKGDLAERHAKLVDRVFALVEAADRLPARVEDDATASKVGDFAAQCKKAVKALGDAHKAEKEVFLRGGQAIDGYFRDLRTDLEEVVKRITKLLEAHMTAKLAAERKRREEEERQRAEELAAKLAEEAEQRKREAETAAAKAAEHARLAAEHGANVEEIEKARLEAQAAAERAAAPPEAAPAVMPAKVEDPRVRLQGQSGRVLVQEEWKWEWIDQGLAGFDLNTIRNFIDPADVSRAMNAAVKQGLRQAGPCVRIFLGAKVRV